MENPQKAMEKKEAVINASPQSSGPRWRKNLDGEDTEMRGIFLGAGSNCGWSPIFLVFGSGRLKYFRV